MLFQCIRPLWPLLFLLAVCSAPAAPEDVKSAFLTVKVVDSSGNAVRSAEVCFVERSSRVKKVQATDEVGNASLELLSGEYELSVTSSGFKSFVMRYVEVKPGKNQQIDVALQVDQDCPPGSCGDADSPSYELEHAELKKLEIRDVKIFAWQADHKNTKREEIQAFRETQALHLAPSEKFDVECKVVGGDDLTGDYFLWTTVDFLLAPVTRAYEQMGDNELGSSVGWGQVMEMRDLKATPIYFLRSNETRLVTVKGLDLHEVLAAFPVGDAGELWPWLMRVKVHVQDRHGKQMVVAERALRLSPSAGRRNSHYKGPLPSR
jgi:hypothetical protein